MVEYGRRSGRAAARRAAAALERTPKNVDPAEDEVMADVTADEAADTTHNDDAQDDAGDDAKDDAKDDAHDKDAQNGDNDNRNGNENENTNNDTADEASAPASGVASAATKSPAASPAPVMMIRRKRLGRPPKNRPPDWDGMVEVPMSESEIAAAQAAALAKERGETLTPRRRGRGGWRGRGGRKGDRQDGHGGPGGGPLQQVIDKDGNVVDIVNDELDLPEDPVGETKVDKDGNLQGGREYRCRTFTVAGRGSRLYMLSTEPARCVGFRDSYLFFTKHKRLYKIIVGDDEKRDMIERDIIPHSYKGRAIGIVTARSVFREFGALIIVGGRRVIDDYTLANEEEGAPPVVEGALADPNDIVVPGEPYNKNQYVAWHGASAVYHASGGGGGGGQGGGGGLVERVGGGGAGGASAHAHTLYKAADAKRRRVAVNDYNWQLEHAREASSFNSMLTAARGTTLAGVYDIHTNLVQYPASMQPQRARAVLVQDGAEAVAGDGADADADATTAFPALSPLVARNFYVADMHLETPPAGIAPAAYDRYRIDDDGGGNNNNAVDNKQADLLAPFQGLAAVPDDIRALLPAECRAAFDAAVDKEQAWFGQWGPEATSMSRREPVIDKAIVPYAMTL
ncbi:chromatin structure-remodeling complex protein RSC7 [Sporothrix brasiliensis 5110]|uniref:Chromatin structure-remodeling complex protein RSC7 n=1 Tax=Sporothrix brasiliensis 5110 TaxID=1398154 RepID=A0A0C2F7V0_9PEZI|nr:chromatin structure-remodeling complex protein RSC7 [Sporothrix brasiliensis 5110]KIH87118.1 chromatin structure-remodeling complex protein RSC7 [Sporothrix brasiliensis 5110]